MKIGLGIGVGFLAGGVPKLQIVNTPGAGTFTVPAGVTSLTVEAWGSGSSGAPSGAASAPGGAGGGYARSVLTVTPGATIYYLVAAGAAKPAGGTIGNAGAASWVNKSANAAPSLATDGVNANGGTATNNTTPGAGGAGTVGGVTFTGGNGGTSAAGGAGGGGGGAGSAGNGGNGGNGTGSGAQGAAGAGGSPDGGAGSGGAPSTQAAYGNAPGGGGGSSWVGGSLSGAGGNGRVKLSW